MLKDRGTIKWTSLMLPEHVQLLKNMWEEDEMKKCPLIDNQTLEIMDEQLTHAYVHEQIVRLKFHHNGYHQSICGKIITLDSDRQTVVLKSHIDQRTISCRDVISIEETSHPEDL